MIGNFPFVAVALLIALGFYTLLFKRNLIKIVIGIELIECGVNLFLITLGYVKGAVAPIYTHTLAPAERMVLPTPQALTLTSIVIGLATTALMLSFAMLIYRRYKTADVSKMRLRG
ncbi:MAG: sodium:proton antiporter [Candidatus Thermoplasmatota archaeon]|nr:sodium:proton antiporter [Candidatus Thermoplasmatota archaeon]